MRFDRGTQEDRMATGVVQLLCKFYDIMASHSQFVSAPVQLEFKEVGQRMLLLMSALHTAAVANGRRAWTFPPKCHLVDHMVTYQAPEWGNPSYFWCYADEDLVGQCIEIAQSCHSKTCAVSALIKWLILVFDKDDE